MRRFKIGDEVIVKCYKTIPRYWDNDEKMSRFMGKKVTILSYFNRSDLFDYHIKEDKFWSWRDEDFEEIFVDFLDDKDVLL